MKSARGFGIVVLGLLAWNSCASAFGNTLYVAKDNASANEPYTNWVTAAATIQEAIDVANAGDVVLVSNGVYETGGKAVEGDLTNRVALDKSITVRSVNGPAVTVIRGSEAIGGGNGDGAVRCAYMANEAVLAGFTLTNGHTRVNVDLDQEQSGGGVWCESPSAVLSNCVLTGNSASYGGGAYAATLYNCTLTGNSANNGDGGGAYNGTLYNCTLTGNTADYGSGGGTYNGTLNNCINYYNTAREGNNWYSDDNGGSFENCCTVPLPSGNGNITNAPGIVSASNPRLLSSSACINAGTNQSWMTDALDMDGEGRLNGVVDIGADEYYSGGLTGRLAVGMTASWSKVRIGYPVTFQADIQGRAQGYVWVWKDGTVDRDLFVAKHSFPSVGVFAVTLTTSNLSGSVSTTLNVTAYGDLYVSPSGSNTAPFDTWAKAATNIQTAINEAGVGCLVWVTNGVYGTGGRAVHGAMTNRVALDKPIIVRSVRGPAVTVIRGSEAIGGGNGDGAVRCAYMTNGAVLTGFTLTNGHTRVDTDNQEQFGGGVWCESPSAVLSNCVLTGNSASSGGGAYAATLYNCTLTGNNSTGNSVDYAYAGGAYDSTLYDCTLTGNTAYDGEGGGAYYGTLYNCTLKSNSAYSGGGASAATLYGCTLTGNSIDYGYGGGAYDGTLYNCTLTGNSADYGSGGGTYNGISYNCIIYYNTASEGSNWYSDSYNGSFEHCCTTPDPGGMGNITNVPMFVGLAVSNLRLLSNSPCINTGTNLDWMVGAADLDGNPRIYGGGRVDMGAYEYRGSLSVIPTNWLAQYGLPIDGSDDQGDEDEDGMKNWQEWRCNTDPTNDTSFLHLMQPFTTSNSAGEGFVLRWQSAAGVRYRLNRWTNLITSEVGYLVRTNIPATLPLNSETDTTAVGSGPWFYQVRVE